MRPDLNAQCQRLCVPSVPITKLLFGDDLTKEVKDINASNKVGHTIGQGGDARCLGHCRGFGYHYASRYNNAQAKKEPRTTQRATTPPEVTAKVTMEN